MRHHFSILPVLLFLLSSPLQAKEQSGLDSLIGADVRHFDYRELGGQGELLDRENGFLPGLLLSGSYNQGDWLVSGRVSFHEGDVAYTGRTNTGVPISTSTRQRITDAELLAGYRFGQIEQFSPLLYLGAANHSWRRDIQPTQTASGSPVRGILETYRWWQAFLGGKVTWDEAPSFNWAVDARLVRIIAPRIEVDYSGLYDNSRLALAGRWGYRLATPLSYAIRDAAVLVIEPYLENYSLGHSSTVLLTRQGVVSGAVFEPDSVGRNYGVSLCMRGMF